jgi:beta-glucosidase
MTMPDSHHTYVPSAAIAVPGGAAAPERRTFPEGFAWGVATSAFQIEGATDTDGRGASIWDTFCKTPGAISDGSDGSNACDHYHRLEADLDLIASLGVDAYRFSIAWPRVQPLGHGAWNEAGFAFYERLIDGALARGLKPYATLYHWDLPQALQDAGGWNARETCDRFAEYAAEVVRRFGDRLASIATHNEPWVVSILGNESGIFAPGIKNRKIAMQVSHHLLLSHGMAVRAMRAAGTRATLGIVLNQSPITSDTDRPEDRHEAAIADGLIVRWYMDPLLLGRYPQDVLAHLGADAPDVMPGDFEIIGTPIDFIGINYYTRQVVSASGPYEPAKRGLPVTDMEWEIYPQGLTDLLVRLDRDYTLPPLYITENGAAFRDVLADGAVHDPDRIAYLKGHVAAVGSAIAQGVDVRGYFLWSLFDNFEWASGYEKRFGIVYVDYANQARYLKSSACWYRDFLLDRR